MFWGQVAIWNERGSEPYTVFQITPKRSRSEFFLNH